MKTQAFLFLLLAGLFLRCDYMRFDPINNPSDAPVADFTVINDNCFAPCTLGFINNSNTASVKFKWAFGDNSSPLTTLNRDEVSHPYTQPGTYTVTLTAYSVRNDSNTVSKSVTLADPGSLTFEDLRDSSGYDLQYREAIQTRDNNYLAVGHLKGATNRVLLQKYDQTGKRLWHTVVGDGNGGTAYVGGIVESTSGNLYVAIQDGFKQAAILAIDANGKTKYEFPIENHPFGNSESQAEDLTINSNGDIVALLNTTSQGSSVKNFRFLRLKDTGSSLMQEDYKLVDIKAQLIIGGKNSIAAVPGGGYIIAASLKGSTGLIYGALIRLNGSGVEDWRKSYNNFGVISRLYDVVPAGGGIYYGVGSNDTDMLLVKATDSHTGEWEQRYAGIFPDEDLARSITMTADGNLALAGRRRPTEKNVVSFQKADLNNMGAIIQPNVFNGGSEAHEDEAFSIHRTKDGGFLIAGSSQDPITLKSRGYLIKTDPNGQVK